MKKICWVNPISHYVYEWWLKFFDDFFELKMYDENSINLKYWEHFNLLNYKVFDIHTKTNFINFYKNPIKDKNCLVLIWDIFTNTLSLNYLFKKNNLFYTEFFNLPNQSFKRKILSKIVLNIFRWKKFIVPTIQSYNTIKKYTKKVLYFPQIYVWPINNEIKIDNNLNILFVWNLWDWKKNIPLILEIAEYYKNNKNITFTLVWWWKDKQKSLFSKYNNLLNSWKVKIIDFVSHWKLNEIYKEADIFIFPSIIDPIWAVVLEAMANGLAIISNSNVWASSYIENNINWFILNEDNKENYIKKIDYLFNNKDILLKFKKSSIELVKKKYWFDNHELLKEKYKQLINFIK